MLNKKKKVRIKKWWLVLSVLLIVLGIGLYPFRMNIDNQFQAVVFNINNDADFYHTEIQLQGERTFRCTDFLGVVPFNGFDDLNYYQGSIIVDRFPFTKELKLNKVSFFVNQNRFVAPLFYSKDQMSFEKDLGVIQTNLTMREFFIRLDNPDEGCSSNYVLVAPAKNVKEAVAIYDNILNDS